MINILFIGDVSGESGIRAINNELKKIVIDNNIDFVIANAENASYGRGLTKNDYLALQNMGVNFFTMGNHAWYQSDWRDVLASKDIIRPYNLDKNFEEGIVGVGTKEIILKNKKIRITNLISSTIFLKNKQTNPFLSLDEILSNDNSDIHIVDFHSETTSEKNAFLIDFKGKVSAILGTHTHIQTADEKIVDNTAYIGDVGMTGSSEGIIGANPKTIIEMFRGKREFFKLETDKGKYQFCAVILTFDEENNYPIYIKRIYIYEK